MMMISKNMVRDEKLIYMLMKGRKSREDILLVQDILLADLFLLLKRLEDNK